MMHKEISNERGASAIIIAASLILLLAFAAVGVDVGAGFNERRQDQTAADLGALAGAVNASSAKIAVEEAIATVRSNLDTTFTDPEWQILWENCTDPDRPTGFVTVDNPFTVPGTAKIDCISANSGSSVEIRVNLPQQFADTAFAGVVGVDEIATDAEAHAGFVFRSGGALMPFGILNGTPLGAEVCLTSSPSGVAIPPCAGSSSGNFGTLNPPVWGNTDMGTTADCSPDPTTLAMAMAMGTDHIILTATGPDGTPGSFPGTGGVHPGAPVTDNSTVTGQHAKEDACSTVSGEALATDLIPAFPINTLWTNTGFPHGELKTGLLGDPVNPQPFPIFPDGLGPRLQRPTTANTMTIRERISATDFDYVVDNTTLWQHLRSPGDLNSDGIPLTGVTDGCNRNHLSTLAWDAARTEFQNCLDSYNIYLSVTPDPNPLFLDSIGDSPRFGWAPMFHYTDWGAGARAHPILNFFAVYLDGLWFNCNGNPSVGGNTDPCTEGKSAGQPGLRVYPQEYPNGGVAFDGASGRRLRLDQVSSFALPLDALPESVQATFPGKVTGPYAVELVR